MNDEQTMVEVAAFYNERARLNPSNPPTRREVAEQFGISTATAQVWLQIIEARGLLCFPLRRRRLRGGARRDG
jgi:predicted ArsR family transcriptional regulator